MDCLVFDTELANNMAAEDEDAGALSDSESCNSSGREDDGEVRSVLELLETNRPVDTGTEWNEEDER
eukprot:2251709-Rhodomonas_salina.3